MNGNNEMIEKLADSEIYKDYERAYSEATGLPVALRPVETWKLPMQGKRKENPFCAMMGTKSGACAACLQMQEQLCQSANNEAATMTCSYGLCEAAVPVKVGGETIAFLQTGQILREQPTPARFQRVVKQLEEKSKGWDIEAVRTAYFQTPVMTPKKLDSIVHLLSVFADHLSIKSNQIAVQQANAEPPAIAKAKQYIQDHHGEKLSLGSVAQAVHMSAFYFCKLFRKATGLHFTEFVSRVRIEKAKNLLLNPNLRVSEIAYEVGFESLTHFNRIFKKIMGQSPTDYRSALPVSA